MTTVSLAPAARMAREEHERRLDAFGTELVLLRLHILLEIKLAILKAEVELIVRRHVEHVF